MLASVATTALSEWAWTPARWAVGVGRLFLWLAMQLSGCRGVVYQD